MISRRFASMGIALATVAVVGAPRTTAAQKPTPVITVSPDSGLSDGQIVEISGSGFQEQTVEIAECGDGNLDAHPAIGPVCTYFTHSVDVQTDADGHFGSVTFAVEKAFIGTRYVNGNHLVSTSYDCSLLNDCYIRVFSLTRGYRVATQSLTFTP